MKEFTFEVYNNRKSSTLTYRLKKTSDGWHISHLAINGDCEPDGTPLLYANLNQDYISYPSKIGSYLNWIWTELEHENMIDDDAQQKLQELADWISSCEQNQPQWQGWNA